MPAPVEPRRFLVRRHRGIHRRNQPVMFRGSNVELFRAIGTIRTNQSEYRDRRKAYHISEQINMTSREDYESVRALDQWAVDLDPHNAAALARLTFAIVTGVLNHWSNDVIGDLHAADLALQDAVRIAPDSMIVRGAQCHILRAMRQFEAAIRVCSEAAESFPEYPFLHKEIGYQGRCWASSMRRWPNSSRPIE